MVTVVFLRFVWIFRLVFLLRSFGSIGLDMFLVVDILWITVFGEVFLSGSVLGIELGFGVI